MTGPELDSLIARVDINLTCNTMPTRGDVASLVSELKIYRAMALRLERCVHELVKEAEALEVDYELLP